MTTETARVTSSFRAAARALETAHARVRSRRVPSTTLPAGAAQVRRDGGPAQAGRFLWLDDPSAGAGR